MEAAIFSRKCSMEYTEIIRNIIIYVGINAGIGILLYNDGIEGRLHLPEYKNAYLFIICTSALPLLVISIILVLYDDLNGDIS